MGTVQWGRRNSLEKDSPIVIISRTIVWDKVAGNVLTGICFEPKPAATAHTEKAIGCIQSESSSSHFRGN